MSRNRRKKRDLMSEAPVRRGEGLHTFQFVTDLGFGQIRHISPDRDHSEVFKKTMNRAALVIRKRLSRGVEELRERLGATDDDLAKAMIAMCRFVQTSCDVPNEESGTALERVGWSKIPMGARGVVLAAMGAAAAVQFFEGVRVAAFGGKSAVGLPDPELQETLDELLRATGE
jgi:hypothetical protein